MKKYPCAWALSLTLIVCIGCQNLNNHGTLSWYAKYAIPVTKKKYTVRSMLLDSSSSVLKGLNLDSTHIGDTLNITYHDSTMLFSRTYVFKQKDISMSKYLGDLQIINTPPVRCSLKVPDMGMGDIPISSPITAICTDSVVLPYLDYVVFDTASDTIAITITNFSKTMTLRNINLTLSSEGTVLGIIDGITALQPGEFSLQTIYLGGKKITGQVFLKGRFTIAKGSIIAPRTGIALQFLLNRQMIQEAMINGLHIHHTFRYTFLLPLSKDTFHTNYFDISLMHIPIKIANSMPLDFKITPLVVNVFDIDYCKKTSIDSAAGLATYPVDSSYCLGNTLDEIQIEGTADPSYPVVSNVDFTIENGRFLPLWSEKDQWSYVPITLSGICSQTNKKIRITKESGFSLEMAGPMLTFREIGGFYAIDKFFKLKPGAFRIPLVTSLSFLKEMRKKFHLINNQLSLIMDFNIPDNSVISRMDFTCLLRVPETQPLEQDTIRFSMHDINKANIQKFLFKVNNIVNSFPDSVIYSLYYTFPGYTPMVFGSDVLVSQPNVATIDMFIGTVYKLKCFMIWEVSDTVSAHLPAIRSAVNFNKPAAKAMKEMSLTFQYSLFNQTNLFCRLFAVGSSSEYKDHLFALQPGEIQPSLLTGEKGKNLIPVLGANGFVIPPRKDSVQASFRLSEQSMQSLLLSDSLYMRWVVLMPPAHADALRDTDYVALDAQLTLEGTQSTSFGKKP